MKKHASLGFALGVAAWAIASPASAANPPCSTLMNPIVVTGSSAIQPFLDRMGGPLAGLNPPTTLVYQSAGSCVGVQSVTQDITPMGLCAPGACAKGTAIYYMPAAVGMPAVTAQCDFDLTGSHVDIGVSDVYGSSCGSALPAGIGDFAGPVQAMLFVTNKGSTQKAITAEEAFLAFGLGAAGMEMPWVDPNFFFIRKPSSGTETLLGYAIQVPSSKWIGQQQANSGAVLNAVTGSATPEATIGILAADFYDQNRGNLKSLAFKAYKQRFAYYPDSTPNAFDKKNVRDGHYVPWGYSHFITTVDNNNVPSKAAARQFLGWLNGDPSVMPAAPFDILDVSIAAHTIPQCAMTVKRSSEVGDLSMYSPDKPCGCYFEFKATGSTSCKACPNGSECGANGACRRGYCEAK